MISGGQAGFGVSLGAIGAVAGAMLPLLTYRLSVDWGTPNRVQCGQCATPFPPGYRGWIRLGARCPNCPARNGPPTWLMAAVVALAEGGLAGLYGLRGWLVPFLLFIPVGVLLGAVDLTCMRLPERLVWPGVGVSLLAFAALAPLGGDWGSLGRAALGGLALGGAYLVLALLPGGQLGLGDVSLAVLLGIYLGWLGWPLVLLGGLLPFLVQVPFAIRVLALGRAGRKTELPFGPAMLVGAYLSVVGPSFLVAILD